MAWISGAVEGTSDELVLRRLVEARGGDVTRVHVQHGKAGVRRALPGYNQAARHARWLVLVDLDRDFPCAPALVADWLPTASRYMCLRVVVRKVEAWLLADAERAASFLRVPVRAVPVDPDALADPKQSLVQLAERSRSRAIRSDMCPRPGSGRNVGPAYTSRIMEFVAHEQLPWRPDVAAVRSPSLSRCLARLDELLQAP